MTKLPHIASLRSANSLIVALLLISSLLGLGCERIKKRLNLGSSSETSFDQSSLNLLYQTAILELSLANSAKPYLVIDIPRKAIEIRLKGAVLLTVPIKLVEAEPGDLEKFIASFGSNGTLLRPVAGKYLFESVAQTPDSVLAIVSSVVNVKAELLQRMIPERFRLYWNDQLNIDIVSQQDSAAAPKRKPKESLQEALQGKFEDMKMEVRYVMRKPFGVRLIVIEANPEDALTIYRITEAGVPTLLQLVTTEPVVPEVKAKKKK